MDSARNRDSGEVVHIALLLREEKQQPGSWERAKKVPWLCDGCGREAWMVRRGKGGTAGWFAAHHSQDPICQLTGRQVANEPGNIDPRLQPIDNAGTIVQLRFDPPAAEGRGEVHADGNALPGAGRAGIGHGDGERQEANARTQGLRALLGHLMVIEGYREGLIEAGQMFEVPERGRVHPGDLIWSLDELDPQSPNQMGRHIIAWGQVVTANDRTNQEKGTGLGFLNQGKEKANRGAVVISPTLLPELVRRHEREGVRNFSGFEGWYVIAFGRTQTMGTAQVRIDPLDSASIVLRPPL